MKKMKTVKLMMALLMGLLPVSGCAAQPVQEEANLEKIKSIAQLSTVDVYIHNVAKSQKKAGTGFWDIGKADRVYWVEYSYRISLGIDTSKIQFDKNGNHIKVVIPPAEILSHGLDENGISEDKIVFSNDNFWNRNEITPEEQTKTVADSMEESLINFEREKSQFDEAQNRARSLLESYFDTLEENAGTDYEIEWVLEPYTVPSDLDERLNKIEQERRELEEQAGITEQSE